MKTQFQNGTNSHLVHTSRVRCSLHVSDICCDGTAHCYIVESFSGENLEGKSYPSVSSDTMLRKTRHNAYGFVPSDLSTHRWLNLIVTVGFFMWHDIEKSISTVLSCVSWCDLYTKVYLLFTI